MENDTRTRKLLGVREIMDRTGLAEITIRKYLAERRWPTVKLGSRVFMESEDLELVIDRARIPALALDASHQPPGREPGAAKAAPAKAPPKASAK